MSEEEKEAILWLEKVIVDKEEYRKTRAWVGTITFKSIEMLLNLIQKQQEKIDLNNKAEIALNNRIMDLETELKKNNKVIDEMAKTILEDTNKLDTFWCNGCSKVGECLYKRIEDCIKQWFEMESEKC